VKAILAGRVGARDNESKLSDLQSSNVELRALSPTLASLAPALLVSLALQLRPKRAQKVPVRYLG
jgi:hypothetical protein